MIASVHSEKTRLKNLIMIIIIIIISMNKSQELTVFYGRQKLTSATCIMAINKGAVAYGVSSFP